MLTSMAGFFKRLFHKITNKAEIDWDDIEVDLVRSDMGIASAMEMMDFLKKKGRSIHAEDVISIAKEHIASLLLEPPKLPQGHPAVILMVGVNGTGKTTSAAKLAYFLKKKGHKVLLAAADTFRAAAVEQLKTWAERLDIDVFFGQPEADPSSVCYAAHQKAIAEGFDYVICDTAGRIHTKHNLMEELGKIERTLSKQDGQAPHARYIVLDASTGGNALNQAREFSKIIPIDAAILTKLDGSGKGGVAIGLSQELQLPCAFIGVGERAEDLYGFDKKDFVEGIL